MQKEIPIFFSIDDGFAPFLATALYSAIQNSSTKRQYKAFVLHQELSEANKEKLSALAASNFQIEFVEMKSGLEAITNRKSNCMRCDFFTLTIYFRLFIPAMFPQYDKGIYIDSDVVVLGDLAELFDTDLGDKWIGGCADKSVMDVAPLTRYMEEAVGVNCNEYINSGVLLMDLKTLREKEFEKHFLRLLTTYHFDSVAPDQDYINAICNGRIHYLEEAWDAMPNENSPALKAPKLVHYNLFSKPWHYDDIQYGTYFWEYIKETGYEQEARMHRENHTKEQKEKDKDCLERLIERATGITKHPVTFKNLFEQGVQIRL